MDDIPVTIQYTENHDVLDIQNLGNRHVVMSNILVRSAQTLNLIEKRIVMSAISKLDKPGPIRLYAQEYAETFGLEVSDTYKQLKDSVKALLTKYLTVTIKDGNAYGKRHYPWTKSVGYVQKKGYIEIEFNSELTPFLLDLKGHFTQYQLKQAAALRSVHSWRLMELLQSMRGKQPNGYLTIEIEEFHLAMESSPSYIKNFNLCRKRMVEPAIKELMEKDGWLIDWQILKMGRKIIALRFDFAKTPQQSFDFSITKDDLDARPKGKTR